MPALTFQTVLRFVVMMAFLAAGASAAMAHPPWGIVVSSTGIVYFSDLLTVWKIDSAGRVSVFRASTGRHVHELSIDDRDNLYGPVEVYEARTEKYLVGVWRMMPDGNETEIQHPIDSVMSGVSIWRDRAGNMYSIEQNNHTKQRTLLLRRTPGGTVSTLAGGQYGHKDGKGSSARLGSVSAMTFAPDGNIYLTDNLSVRRVTLDGTVTTLATNLAVRTSEDKPTLFGGVDASIMGLAVDHNGNVYVADAGNRRLLRIAKDGTVGVVYRLDPPYFPTGVFATRSGDVHVLEFSYTPPGRTDNPRVRKISADGQNRILASTGVIRTEVVVVPPSEVSRSRFKSIALVNRRLLLVVLLVLAGVGTVSFLLWFTSRKQRI